MVITLLQINEDRVRLSAAGLFQVGVHLIPSVSVNFLNRASRHF
jgi:hypothetical protein